MSKTFNIDLSNLSNTITKKSYTFTNDMYSIYKDIDLIGYALERKKDGTISVDLIKVLKTQFLEEGVLESNIYAYVVDTYKAAETGNGFSHRFSMTNNTKEGRFAIAVQLS